MSNNTLVTENQEDNPEIKKNELDEYELAAQEIQLLFSHFRKYGYELAGRKKKAPIRVLEAFLFEGLHDIELSGDAEKNLLVLCKQVMYHKNKLVEYMLKRKQEEEQNNEQSKEE